MRVRCTCSRQRRVPRPSWAGCPTAPWVDGSAPEVEKLNAAGADAALLTGDPKGGQVQVPWCATAGSSGR